MNRDDMWASKRQGLTVRASDGAGVVIGKVVTIDDWTACVVGVNPLGAVVSRWFDPRQLQAATAAEGEIYDRYDDEERALEALGLRRGEVDQLREQAGEQAGVIAELRAQLERDSGAPRGTLMDRYQRPLAEWQERELPCDDKDKQTVRVALGACEEMGEVARCVLKRSQEIRATSHVWTMRAQGEIGDVCVYLMQLCTLLGLDFEQCIDEAAGKVLARRFATTQEVGDGQD